MDEKVPLTDQPPEIACTHRKWNVRSLAYQSLINQFQNLPSNSKEWDLYKNLMSKIALESSPSIREQALEVILLYVQRCATAEDSCADVMNSLLDKILVLNKNRGHELLLQIIMQYVEIGCAGDVIEQLLNTASDIQTGKVPTACIRIITNILSVFGPKPLDLKYILESLSHFKETGDVSFRSALKCLMLELLCWLGGPKALTDLDDVLNPAEMKAVIKEYEDYRKAGQIKRLRFQDDQENVWEKCDSTEPFTEEPLYDLFGQLDDAFFKQLDSQDWTERRDALLELNKILDNCSKLQPANYEPLLTSLKKIITEDQCVIVVGFAITSITGIAKGLQQNFSPYAIGICRILFEKFVEKRQHITEQLRRALDAITATTTFESLIKTINGFLDSKNPTIRFETIQLLAKMFSKSTKQTLRKPEFTVVYKSLADCLHHGQLIIREKSLIALGVALEVVGESIIMPFLKNVDPIIKTRLMNYRKEFDSFGEKYNEIKYRNVSKKDCSKNEEKFITANKDHSSINRPKESETKYEKSVEKRNDIKIPATYESCMKLKRSLENSPIMKHRKVLKILSTSNSESSLEWYSLNSELEKRMSGYSSITNSPDRTGTAHKLMSEQRLTDNQKKYSCLISPPKKKNDYQVQNLEVNREMMDGSSNLIRNVVNKTSKETHEPTQGLHLAHRSTKSINLTKSKSNSSLRPATPERQKTECVYKKENVVGVNKSSERIASIRQRSAIKSRPTPFPAFSDCNITNVAALQQSNLSLAMANCCEGFIILTESEVKKLLGLKNRSPGSDDSGNIVDDKLFKKDIFRHSCRFSQMRKPSMERDTQTGTPSTDDDYKSLCSVQPNQESERGDLSVNVNEIPTQTEVTVVSRGTDPCRVKRYQRGTQWVQRPQAEVQTQTPKVRTVEVASGPTNATNWSTVAWSSKDLNNTWTDSSNPRMYRKRGDPSPVNLQSILLKKIEYREPTGKEFRGRLDLVRNSIAVGTDPPTRRVHSSKRTVEINSFTVTRSRPFDKGDASLKSLKPRSEKKNSRKYEIRTTKGRLEKNINEKPNSKSKANAKTTKSCINSTIASTGSQKAPVALCSLSKISVMDYKTMKDKKRKPTREVRMQTSSHMTSSADLSNDIVNKKRNIHLKGNERYIRLKRVDGKKSSRSKSSPCKKVVEKLSQKNLKLEKSEISLTKRSRSKQRKLTPKPSAVKKISKIKQSFDSSSVSIKEGCNLLPLMAKSLVGSNAEWKEKKSLNELSRQHIFKPSRSPKSRGQHQYMINHVKRVSSHSTKISTKSSSTCERVCRPKFTTPFEMNPGDPCNLDPRTKQLILEELLKVCEISQTTFEKMMRRKSSRPCLFTPKAILQRVNELSNSPDQNEPAPSDARCETDTKDLKTCTIM